MGVKTKECSQAQRNLVSDLFKQGKTYRLIQEATGMALGTISNRAWKLVMRNWFLLVIFGIKNYCYWFLLYPLPQF